MQMTITWKEIHCPAPLCHMQSSSLSPMPSQSTSLPSSCYYNPDHLPRSYVKQGRQTRGQTPHTHSANLSRTVSYIHANLLGHDIFHSKTLSLRPSKVTRKQKRWRQTTLAKVSIPIHTSNEREGLVPRPIIRAAAIPSSMKNRFESMVRLIVKP
jgi:hypothetical protein